MAESSKKALRQSKKSQKKSQTAQRLGLLALAVLLVGGGVWWYQASEAERPGVAQESQGRDHKPQDFVAVYNTSPPTSGPHAGAAAWGEYKEELPHVNQVHNLEHGGVLIQYNCEKRPQTTTCYEVVSGLRKVFNQARKEVDKKIILAPYSKMERPIALTAWTRLQYLDAVDEAAILAFVRGNINRAPERVE